MENQDQYLKKLWWLLGISFCFKLFVGTVLELGNDEVYYWTYALQPDYNHFDHPPMVGLLIRLTTFNLHWVSGLSLRLGAIIGCGISSIFIFKTGKQIANERVGWYAALLYNVSIYTGFIAGLFILPDSPQMPFWTAALYVMSLLITEQKEKQLSTWLGLGLLIGLACLCKVHGLYLWAGFGIYILFNQPKWLLNYRLYLGFVATLIFFLPIVYWNILNDFITYKFHSERVTKFSTDWDNLLQELVGEFAYQHPIVFVISLLGIGFSIKHSKLLKSQVQSWLFWMSIPMIVFFWSMALFNSSLPHWSGPGYIPLYFMAGQYLSTKSNRLYPISLRIAMGGVVMVVLAGYAFTRYLPLQLGSKDMSTLGETNPLLDISGWSDFGNEFNAFYLADVSKGNMQKDAPIVVNNWFPGGHILFYVARATGQPVIGIGKLNELHKFAWLNKMMPALALQDNAYFIVPSNVPCNELDQYLDYFTSIEKAAVIDQKVGGKLVRYFTIYRMKKCKRLPEKVF